MLFRSTRARLRCTTERELADARRDLCSRRRLRRVQAICHECGDCRSTSVDPSSGLPPDFPPGVLGPALRTIGVLAAQVHYLLGDSRRTAYSLLEEKKDG